VDLDLGEEVIQRINTSSKTLEALLKTLKTKQKFKPRDGTKPDAKIMKKQVEKGCRTLRASDQ
jgi:hypothetical protein